MGLLLDDFYFLEVNRTATSTGLAYEGQFLFISQIVSTSFRDTYYNCFLFMKQVEEKAKTDNMKFVDDEDRFTSFLFNMLSNSFDIRSNSELLIKY